MKKFYLVFFVLGLVIISSGCINTEPENPEGVVESYFNNIAGFSEDIDSAYNQLSSGAQNEMDYEEYSQEITDLRSEYEGRISSEILTVNTVEKTEDSATVEISYNIESITDGFFNEEGRVKIEESEVELILEDDQWKIDEVFNPIKT